MKLRNVKFIGVGRVILLDKNDRLIIAGSLDIIDSQKELRTVKVLEVTYSREQLIVKLDIHKEEV